jgi:hypothetical protein
MAKVQFEIHCNDCPSKGHVKECNEGWFIVNINTAWAGRKLILVCPKCGTEHPRTIDKKGEMVAKSDSDRRFIGSKPGVDVIRDNRDSDRDRILPLLSAWSVKPRLELLKVVPCGFLNEVWLRKAAAEKGIIDPDFEDSQPE